MITVDPCQCDLLKPQCSRCKHFKTECIGAGEKRYIFVTTTSKGEARRAGSESSVSPFPALSRTPSNEQTHLVGDFVDKLRVTDLRYALWVYGDFLADIPRRLGQNQALDAAVDVFTAATTVLHTGLSSTETQQKYVTALAALRMTLGSDMQQSPADILCAIHLLIIVQYWLGVGSGPLASHSRGTVQLLKPMAERRRDGVEDALVKIMCLPVVSKTSSN
jgi:hypothetical protein